MRALSAARYTRDMTSDELAASLLKGLHDQLPDDVELAGFELEIGDLVDVDVSALRRALEEAAPGVEVVVTRVAGLLRCLDCGARYPSDEHPCPVCGSGRAELEHGEELGMKRAWVRRRDMPAPESE